MFIICSNKNNLYYPILYLEFVTQHINFIDGIESNSYKCIFFYTFKFRSQITIVYIATPI